MPLYRFDGFEFDSATGELDRDGRRVRLRPQPARVLEHLLVRQGELVSREELRRAIWPDGTYVHFDHGLNSCIKQIRAALADRKQAPRYIETLVKRGFRFVGGSAASFRHSACSSFPGIEDFPADRGAKPCKQASDGCIKIAARRG
jgi:DNA-binding winged helix-turn-helix (wHTH) protein